MLHRYINMIADDKTLSADETAAAFEIIFKGEASEGEIGAFLMGLKMRGETKAEILGAATAMRAVASKINAPKEAIDIVGTGGDGGKTFNISTISALVVAGAGIKVAKHGSVAASSKSGSADLLRALGINLETEFSVIEDAIQNIGIGFMWAPMHHKAMKHVMGVRKSLKMRTIFNILGPLCNPASVNTMLIGVFDEKIGNIYSEILPDLQVNNSWVVHGHGGLDELGLTGESQIWKQQDGNISYGLIHPTDANLNLLSDNSELAGGTPEENAKIAMDILANKDKSAKQDIVVLNAAAAICLANKAENMKEAAALAKESISSGSALEKLKLLAEKTNNG